MNIERSPVVNDVVVLRLERDDDEIWQGSFHALGNLRLLGDFPDNFDVGLIRERCKYDFPHEPRTIRYEDPDSFFHCSLPRTVSVGSPSVGPPSVRSTSVPLSAS